MARGSALGDSSFFAALDDFEKEVTGVQPSDSFRLVKSDRGSRAAGAGRTDRLAVTSAAAAAVQAVFANSSVGGGSSDQEGRIPASQSFRGSPGVKDSLIRRTAGAPVSPKDESQGFSFSRSEAAGRGVAPGSRSGPPTRRPGTGQAAGASALGSSPSLKHAHQPDTSHLSPGRSLAPERSPKQGPRGQPPPVNPSARPYTAADARKNRAAALAAEDAVGLRRSSSLMPAQAKLRLQTENEGESFLDIVNSLKGEGSPTSSDILEPIQVKLPARRRAPVPRIDPAGLGDSSGGEGGSRGLRGPARRAPQDLALRDSPGSGSSEADRSPLERSWEKDRSRGLMPSPSPPSSRSTLGTRSPARGAQAGQSPARNLGLVIPRSPTRQRANADVPPSPEVTAGTPTTPQGEYKKSTSEPPPAHRRGRGPADSRMGPAGRGREPPVSGRPLLGPGEGRAGGGRGVRSAAGRGSPGMAPVGGGGRGSSGLRRAMSVQAEDALTAINQWEEDQEGGSHHSRTAVPARPGTEGSARPHHTSKSTSGPILGRKMGAARPPGQYVQVGERVGGMRRADSHSGEEAKVGRQSGDEDSLAQGQGIPAFPASRSSVGSQGGTPVRILPLHRTGSTDRLGGAGAPQGSSGGGASRHSKAPVSMQELDRWLDSLQRGTERERRDSAASIKAVLKGSQENKRRLIAAQGIGVLVHALQSPNVPVQEDCMAALLSLSLIPGASAAIIAAGGIEQTVHILKSSSTTAKESAAAALFALSAEEEHQMVVQTAGAIPSLVDILEGGSVRGKKDAALVLFNLSRNRKCAIEIVHEGTVAILARMLASPLGEQGLEEKSMAVLANLCRTREGCRELIACDTVPALVAVLQHGSDRAKEDSAMALLMLANSEPQCCDIIVDCGGVNALQELARSGTQRSRSKANSLLDILPGSR